jgi:hypothetical protein
LFLDLQCNIPLDRRQYGERERETDRTWRQRLAMESQRTAAITAKLPFTILIVVRETLGA